MTRILTKNGVDNTNIDGARNYNFNAGRRSGIVKGALNQGNFFASSSNTIVLDSCELRLCGHRVVIDSAEYLTFYNKPSVPIRYSLVAQIIVDNNSDVSFDLHAQTSSTALVQDNLDASGSGTFELEIGRFTQLTDGTVTDVVRTADLITGGAGGGDSEYIRIGTVTTNKISPELDADVDIENTINPDDNKPQTNFTFNLPTPSGTVVSLNGVEKTSINTDITPNANSENLITSGGVHDYPAIAFAESERQKSKNLLNPKLLIQGATVFANGSFSTDTTYVTTSQKINVEPNSQIVMSANIGIDADAGFVFFNDGVYVGYAKGVATTIVPSNANQVVLNFHATGITPQSITTPQLEYGSAATDYQPYNGAIVHEKQLPKITTLWTNPNLSNDFSSQTITLANDNYDYAIMICAGRTNELDTQVSFFFEKGTAPILNYVLTSTDAAYSVENICRRVLYTNNTALNIGNCTYSLTANAGVVANNLLIPYKVIGIKMGE